MFRADHDLGPERILTKSVALHEIKIMPNGGLEPCSLGNVFPTAPQGLEANKEIRSEIEAELALVGLDGGPA